LSDAEYAMLGKSLRDAKAADFWPYAVEAARFLALTGWRSGEALGLLWSQIDIARRTATLMETKTGKSVRPLSNGACDILRQFTPGDGLVFRANRGDGQMSGFRKIWDRMMKLGSVPTDVTPNVLRHSFASLASDLGYSEPTIAAMVGHKGRTITARYIHAADAVLLAAADTVANKTAELMGELKVGIVVELRKQAPTHPHSGQ
jgi:integrase